MIDIYKGEITPRTKNKDAQRRFCYGNMDIKMQILLKTHRSALKDITVEDILDDIISSETLTEEDIENIKSKTKRIEKVNTLIDIVSKNGPPCYMAFVDSLSKDYDWLWKNLQIKDTIIPIEMEKDALEDILRNGNVPKLPVRYVKRLDLEKQLHDKLTNLKRHSTLALHGMSGSGKSSLIISTLRNNSQLVFNDFHGKVFWISVSDCTTDDQIIQLQSRLHRRLEHNSNMIMSTSTSSINIGSLEYSDYSIQVDQDWKEYRTKLGEAFSKDLYKEALLILDDPRNKEVVDAFDFGCKLLVTTQDSSFVDNTSTILKVSNNLSEEESLKLISLAIEEDISKLPDEAKKMHQICYGTPLFMAMLGGLLADNKDSLKHDRSKWKSFLKPLKNKSSFLNRMNSRKNSKDYNSRWLELGIDSLENNDLKMKYKSLAILPDNIKVSVKALAVILNMDENHVEDFMIKLEKKSLIVEHYNIERKTYEYEINDLIMTHLKNIHSENELKRLHSQLIKRYMMKCPNNSLVNLLDDGYIAYFVAYHISRMENSDEMYEMFTSLFTNLEFIGNKIRLVGPSDTIEDLKKYSNYILKSSESVSEFINSIEKFISNYGYDLYYYPYTDILQSIMQYEPIGKLFDEASSLVKKEHHLNHIYFQFLPIDDSEIYTVMNIGSELSFIKFWSEYVFIGHTDGSIVLWSVNDNQKIKTFYGHKAAIISIAISFQSPCKMGSVSDDGVIKIWNINDPSLIEQDSSSDGEDETSSVCDTHNSIATLNHPSGSFRIIIWARNRNIFLSYTSPGNVLVIHDLKKNTSREISCEKNIEIKCSLLSFDDSLVIIGYNHCEDERYGINMYCRKSGNCMMTFIEYNKILNIALMPGDKQSILVLTNKYVQKHKWKEVLLSDLDQIKGNFIHSKIIELSDESKYDLYMMTLGVNNIIFISTTDYRILAYDINSSDLLYEFNNHRGIISMMDYMNFDITENSYSGLLITASGGDQTFAKLWFVDAAQFKIDHVRKSPKFDCVFDNSFVFADKLDKISPLRDSPETPIRRVKTLSNGNKNTKPSIHKTTSLDRQTHKNSNLKNLLKTQNANSPLVAIIDTNKCVQIFNGNKLIAKTDMTSYNVTCVALSPCGRFLIYGLENGEVFNFILKSKSSSIIMEARKDPIHYLEFLNNTTVVAGGKISSLMIYNIVHEDLSKCTATMLIKSYQELGSQEILNSLSDRKKSPSSYSKFNSHSSSDSINTVSDKESPDFSKGFKFETLHRHSPTIKCIMIKHIGMLSIELDGHVKLWNTEYKLLNVLISNEDLYLTNVHKRKEDMYVTCVCVRKKHIIMCDKSGNFRIYSISIHNSPTSLNVKNITSHRISEKIVSCDLSCDEKYLAMGCASGNIVLWDVFSKILISTIKFHKETVYSLVFSPTPIKTQPIADSIVNDLNPNEYTTPLVLISLAGQICCWDVTYIINKKKITIKNKSYSKNILSPFDCLVPSSPMDLKTSTESHSSSINNEFNFDFCQNSDWEKLWKNKKAKNNKRKELLNCIKLKGERAFKIITNNTFSTFVTIDQGGVLHIMNMFQNNDISNGFHHNHNSS